MLNCKGETRNSISIGAHGRKLVILAPILIFFHFSRLKHAEAHQPYFYLYATICQLDRETHRTQQTPSTSQLQWGHSLIATQSYLLPSSTSERPSFRV